jgi:hypothetical protein
MIRKILTVVAGLTISAGITWAGTLDTNPADFPLLIDWCANFGCAGATLATPQTFTGAGGISGLVGNNATGLPFTNLQQGNGWSGFFPAAMGLVYNGAQFNGVGDDIAVFFNEGVAGVGAYIQADFYTSFSYTMTTYDSSSLVLGVYGPLSGGDNAPFIGAQDATADIWAVVFDAVGGGSFEPDFAIGTVGVNFAPAAPTPEPASMLLIAPALLGLAAFGRKRMMNSRRGNN